MAKKSQEVKDATNLETTPEVGGGSSEVQQDLPLQGTDEIESVSQAEEVKATEDADAQEIKDAVDEAEIQLNMASETDSSEPLPTIPLKLIGVFFKNWVQSTQVSPSASEKIFTSFRADTIIYDQDEVLRLKSIGAPMKVYVEYGSD